MDKRSIDKKDFHLIKRELDFFEDKNLISNVQKSNIIDSYELKGKADFIRVVSIVGALLIGAGILTFIAGNWAYLTKLTKFLLIVLSITGINFIGYKLEPHSPKTSRAVYYLGVLIFGAGIFLVGQTFNLGGEFSSAFLLWSVGIIGIGVFLKDSIILSFSVVLLLIYTNSYYSEGLEAISILSIIIAPLLYFFTKYTNYNKIYMFLINTLLLNVILLLLLKWTPGKNSDLITSLVMFGIGIFMYYFPFKHIYSKVTNVQGGLLHWITGFILTFSGVWGTFSDTNANIIWGIAYFIFALFLMNRGSLLSIFIVCSIILRFYIDVSYDFLPQSLVFVIGGLILVGFGYYFERQRRKGREF